MQVPYPPPEEYPQPEDLPPDLPPQPEPLPYAPSQPPPIYYPPPPRRRRRNHLWRNGCTGCCLGIGIFIGGMLFLLMGSLLAYRASPPPTTNLLILGSDARPGTEDEKFPRTDSIMVLSFNAEKQTISLFSLPRDVFIESPKYGWLRANTVLRSAELDQAGTGVNEMIASMENTFGMDIDNYAQVSFQGFVDLVDALGGLTIDVPKHIVDETYPTGDYGTTHVEFQAGKQHMDGETALIYARTRHADDDFQRASRQQQVMSAVLGKIANPLNWFRLPAVWAAFSDNTETDLNLGEMLRLAPGILLDGRGSGQIEQLVVERENIYRGANGEAFPNVETIRPWIETYMK